MVELGPGRVRRAVGLLLDAADPLESADERPDVAVSPDELQAAVKVLAELVHLQVVCRPRLNVARQMEAR
jgi:hypothetical protein